MYEKNFYIPEVDGEKIDFVVKKDVYKPPQDEKEKNANDDDYVLSKLFKSSGKYGFNHCY